MIIIIIINSLLLLLLIVLIVIKTVHFYKFISTKRRTFINWFYFNHKAVVRSHSSKSIELKQKQNRYSVRIGLVLLAIGFALVLEFLMFGQSLPGTQQDAEHPTAPTIKR